MLTHQFKDYPCPRRRCFQEVTVSDEVTQDAVATLRHAGRKGAYAGMALRRHFHVHYVAGTMSKDRDVSYSGHKLRVRF